MTLVNLILKVSCLVLTPNRRNISAELYLMLLATCALNSLIAISQNRNASKSKQEINWKIYKILSNFKYYQLQSGLKFPECLPVVANWTVAATRSLEMSDRKLWPQVSILRNFLAFVNGRHWFPKGWFTQRRLSLYASAFWSTEKYFL